MRKVKTAIPASSVPLRGTSHACRGFSLVELMIAMAVFVVVAGAAFSLFGQQASIATQQQSLSGVNIGLRNAMSQTEMDMAGGGGNLLAGAPANTPAFYLSVIVNNNMPGTAATCTPNTTTWAYPIASACFDSLTILSPNNSIVKQCAAIGAQTPPLNLAANANLSAASTVTANDAISAGNNAADIACFKNGDELLFITPAANGGACDVSTIIIGQCINVATLTSDATVAGGVINLQVSATGAQSSDPLGIMYQPGGVTYFTDLLSVQFKHSTPAAYIVDLGTASNAVTYAVLANPANANDPQLVRCPGTACTSANAQVVTDQVIGFKVGADLWNGKSPTTGTDIANYNYNGATYCSDAISGVDCTTISPLPLDPYDFTLVRAVRVSLIARTTPRSDATLHTVFLNGFDNGPYLVQQESSVVDLRNLSNVDSNN
jgi:prepilin-type N-terminal cleavage/methylation domain-containing protein